MTRIFRKYSRAFLLVFMSLLLVIFLIQDAVGRKQKRDIEASATIEIGRAWGKPVTQADLRRASTDLRIAGALGFNVPMVLAKTEVQRDTATYLLLEEAARTGVRVSRPEIIEQLGANPESGAVFDGLCQRHEASPEAIYQSLERVLAAVQLGNYLVEASVSESEPRIERNFQVSREQADALCSAIDSKAFLPKVAAPTEDELKALFDEAKSRKEAHTEDALSFGYLIPDRVQIEYLTVDPKDLLATVGAREKDIKKYFEENKQRYTKPVDGPIADPSNPPSVPMTYEEAKERVKEEYRAAKAATEAQSIINRIRDEARQPWDAMPPDEKGVRPQPAESAVISFESLKAKHGNDSPVRFTRTELIDVDALGKEPGLREARATMNRRSVFARQLAFHVTGLSAQAALGEFPMLHVGEPSPVMVTMAPGQQQTPQQAYLFRVIKVAPSGPPASLDEVRERVTRDAKLRKAHELAGDAARQLAERAKQVGLSAAVAEAADLKQILTDAETLAAANPAEFGAGAKFASKLDPIAPVLTRQSASASNFGFSTSLGEKTFATTTQPAAEAAHRVVCAPIARAQTWVVAELLGVKPLYQDDFKTGLQRLRQQAVMTKRQQFVMSWFSAEGIEKRAGWTPKHSADAETAAAR